jgi:hypothetical protein
MAEDRQWGQFEAAQQAAARAAQNIDNDTLKCPNCKSTWFEKVELFQFKENHTLLHGQSVPAKVGPFIFLRCARCDELTEPRLIRQAKDNMDKFYDSLLDTLEEKDKEKKEGIAEKV